jgi:DUF1680 family protein
LQVSPSEPVEVTERPDLLGGILTLSAPAQVAAIAAGWDNVLYRPASRARGSQTETALRIVGIPYYAWANREPGQMRVWLGRG